MPILSLWLFLKPTAVFFAVAVYAYFFVRRPIVPNLVKGNHIRYMLSVNQTQQYNPAELRQKHEIDGPLVLNSTEGILERTRSSDSMVMLENNTDVSLVSLCVKTNRAKAFALKRLKVNSSYPCPDIDENPYLDGQLSQDILLLTNLKESDVVSHHPFLRPGGHWKPSKCVARYKVAIVIPFRNRRSQLTRLLDFLVPFLRKQLLDFRFIVTEQYGQDLFNKGRIMNAAFRLAERLGVDCMIFHDVDMFPQDDRNSYGCSQSPRHIGAYVNTLDYQLRYKELVGGVLAMTMEQYRAINGYSNMYWGWGGEDDDMGKRLTLFHEQLSKKL